MPGGASSDGGDVGPPGVVSGSAGVEGSFTDGVEDGSGAGWMGPFIGSVPGSGPSPRNHRGSWAPTPPRAA